MENKEQSINEFMSETTIDVNNVQLPGLAQLDNDVEELISKDIEKTISADVVKNIDIKETSEIDIPSYLIDIRGVAVSQATLLAIKGMLRGGDTSVYIKTSDTSVIKVGSGDSYDLYLILEDLLRIAYKGMCKIYKNSGDGFKDISVMDASSIKLNL